MGITNTEKPQVALFWFRRDFRLDDNAGLYHALKSQAPVLPIFIYDTDILYSLEDPSDPRVTFIYDQVNGLNEALHLLESTLITRKGKPVEVIRELLITYHIQEVYCNHDYEPYAIKRDEEIKLLCNQNGIQFYSYKDQVIFEKAEVLTGGQTSYKVYSSYKNKWLEHLNDFYIKPYPCHKYDGNFYKQPPQATLTLEEIGFKRTTIFIPGKEIVEDEIALYDKTRNFPKDRSTSRLGIHLRFGTLPVRQVVAKAKQLNDTWLNELIWREFFMQLLYHFPFTEKLPFNTKFNSFPWRHHDEEFAAWCIGKTGYPLVDAGMRELNATGYMHNRVRLVAASFLTKHLLMEWTLGDHYFSQRLLDYELAANCGNWQWCAGTGADAQPFIRIFNPSLQQKKFDPALDYIRKWVPEYGTPDYPKPIVPHEAAVERALNTFRNFRSQSESK